MHTRLPRVCLGRFVVGAGLMMLAAAADGATYTWTKGGGTLDWNTAANWGGTKPGASDTAKFGSSGLASSDTIILGANQTVSQLDLAVGTGISNLKISGGGYTLTLAGGKILGSSQCGSPITIDAPIVLGANASFTGNFVYTPGGPLEFRQPISDGGNNYGVTFEVTSQPNFLYTANNTYGGMTQLRTRALLVRGPNGALTNSSVNLSLRDSQSCTLLLDNTRGVNTNRLSDTRDFLVDYSGGELRVYGTNALGGPVSETVGAVQLNRGNLRVVTANYGSGATLGDVQLRLAGINRTPGTGMNIENATGTAGLNNRIGVAGAVNTNGIWQPWAVWWSYWTGFLKVNATGWLEPLVAGDYTTLPTSGADPAKPHRITATTPVALTASESVYALYGWASSNVTVRLGAYDLRVVSGAILGRDAGGPVIESTGGRLLFGGDEIILGAGRNIAGDYILRITSPYLCEGAGTKRIVVPASSQNMVYQLRGQDLNGSYGSIHGTGYATIELGGPSDRTVTEYLSGQFNILKTGAGTLTLAGTDQRGQGSLTVQEGRLVLASSNAHNPGYNPGFIVTNATVEVAAGVNHTAVPTLRADSTVTGDGRFNNTIITTNRVGIAPGAAVGKLTCKGATIRNGSNVLWELGNGTTTAGTDYDLLNIDSSGGLTFSTGTVYVHVYATGSAWSSVRGKTFTLIDWTGTDPGTTPTTWTVVNHSPTKLDTSAATVTVDKTANKVLLTGLMPVPSGTAVLVR